MEKWKRKREIESREWVMDGERVGVVFLHVPYSWEWSASNFRLVISMLCKTEWSWELRTWSHKMNLLDILSTSPHYFCRKWTGVTNDNSNFDLGVFIPRSCSRHPFSNIHCVILRAASLSIKQNEREKKKATPAAGGTMKRTRSYPGASRSCLACYSLLTVKKYKRLLVVLNS